MKKQRKRPQRKAKQTQHAQAEKKPATNRWALLRNGILLAALVGVGGAFAANTVMATMAEHDLARVGQGVPMVVQVHDRQCTSCQQLQRETRAALKAFAEDELQYAVADIASTSGAAFANQYGAPHVTLLFFDGAGGYQGQLRGVRPRDELQTAFARLVAADS
ncbi:hypothetical protein SLH49_08370 [Cognatiyoonia sp. IB215446]|uniref:hypothetical protein n=1 Tax=Cognatiyoonia sp. IB215446 TaxID=3097355 RepID=UPI002A143F5B|nr:hypothetical protein [Cognatiyoonia sp. IB215446]MDX8347998.1 hypothetical protein [Cognatiyoonia sp. IB215446]